MSPDRVERPRQVPMGLAVILTRVMRQDMDEIWAVCKVSRKATSEDVPLDEVEADELAVVVCVVDCPFCRASR